jgi:hypothetical protein
MDRIWASDWLRSFRYLDLAESVRLVFRERFVAQAQKQMYYRHEQADVVLPEKCAPAERIRVEPTSAEERRQHLFRRVLAFGVVSALAGVCLAAAFGNVTPIAGALSALALVAAGLVSFGNYVLDNTL